MNNMSAPDNATEVRYGAFSSLDSFRVHSDVIGACHAIAHFVARLHNYVLFLKDEFSKLSTTLVAGRVHDGDVEGVERTVPWKTCVPYLL